MTVVIGPLLERGRRRLLIGTMSVYLPRGILCELVIGRLVRVTYHERDGLRIVETIRPLPEEGLVWPRPPNRVQPPRDRL
jgi:hypothetical protein